MKHQISLRPFRDEDAPSVLAIFASNTPEFFAPTEAPDFTTFLSNAQSDAMVAIDTSGAVVGYGAWYRRTPAEGGLAWGMVHRSWHRRGVGRALLDARIEQLWSSGVMQILVQTSQHSAGFFERTGFVVTHVQADGFAPGIDQVTMLLERTG